MPILPKAKSSHAQREDSPPSVPIPGSVSVPHVANGTSPVFQSLSTVMLDTSNRFTRTPIAWIFDNSPSLSAFVQQQLDSSSKLFHDLGNRADTAQTIMPNMIQLGVPMAHSTHFQELATFEVPTLVPCDSTPLHLAIRLVCSEFETLLARLREEGLDRTQSVCVFTTDGGANGCTSEELGQAIGHFHVLCQRFSIVPVVVAVGDQLNTGVLKALTTTLPPIRLPELNVDLLLTFIKQLVVSASRSRRGKDDFTIQLPPGLSSLN